MNDRDPTDAALPGPDPRSVQVDCLADQFELEWRSGSRPDLAHYLALAQVELHPQLLFRLACIDLGHLKRDRKPADPKQYAALFPHLWRSNPDIARRLGEFATRLEVHDQNTVDFRCAPTVEQRVLTTEPDTRPSNELMAGVNRPVISGYNILGRLGEGGMGVVWRAVQLATKRQVALKLMSAASFGSDRAWQRFDREVELAARLEHPNIASVYDSGISKGVCYYAMQLVEGLPLDEYVKRHKPTDRQVVGLFQLIGAAVQHAHQRGIIHRDLKPSNILVTEGGQPMVLDFGLAKSADPDLALSIDGEVSGTPAYMSPEQARGLNNEIDTRSDVYSLGVILYQLLVGRLPHDMRGSYVEMLKRIAEVDIGPPRHHRSDLNGELEAILLKALARDPRDRYIGVGTLAADLKAYLAGEPIVARPATALYLLGKRLRRYKGRLAIAASLLVLLTCSGVGSYFSIMNERDVAVKAEREKEAQRAEAKKQEVAALTAQQATAEQAERTRSALYAGTIGLADALLKEGDYQRARDLLASCPSDLRHWEWRYLNRIAREEHNTIRLKEEAVGLCFSPTSNLLAIATTSELSIWDFNQVPPVRIASASGLDAVTAIAFDLTGSRIATATKAGTINIWDTATLEPESAIPTSLGEIKSFAFLSSGEGLVVLSTSGKAQILRRETSEWQTRDLNSADDQLLSLAVSSDSRFVASGAASQKVWIWDLLSGRTLAHPRLQNYQSQVIDLAFVDGDQSIAYLTAFNHIGTRNRDTGAEIWSNPVPGYRSKSLAALSNSNRLAAAYGQGITLLDSRVGSRLQLLQLADRSSCRFTTFSSDGRLVAGAFDNRSSRVVRIWNTVVNRRVDLLRDISTCFDVALERTSGRWAYGRSSYHPTIVELDGTRRETIGNRAPASGNVCNLAWSRDGKRLAWVAKGGIAVFDVESGSQTADLELVEGKARYLTFADGDRTLLAMLFDGALIGWDIDTGTRLWQQVGGEGATSLVASPNQDDEVLVVRPSRNPVLVRSSDGTTRRTFGLEFPRAGVVFSPDGRRLYGKSTTSISCVEWPSGTTLWRRPNPDSSGNASLAVSTDGRRIAEKRLDNTIQIWDAVDGHRLVTLNGVPSDVYGLSWSAGGEDLYAANQGAGKAGLVAWRSGAARSDALDALALCSPRNAIAGEWVAEGPTLVGKGPLNFVLEAPVRLYGSYRVEIEAIRRTPKGSLGIALPVAGRQCHIEVAGYFSDGYLSGLDVLDGKDLRARIGEEGTCVQGLHLETGKPTRVVAEVRVDGDSVHISATVDGRKFVDWNGRSSSLGAKRIFSLATPEAVGLLGHSGEVEYRKFVVEPFNGDYEIAVASTTSASRWGLLSTGGSSDILPAIDPAAAINARLDVTEAGRRLEASRTYGRVPIAVAPRGDYELTAVFRRLIGKSTVSFILPIKGGQVAAIFDTDGKYSGLSRVGGQSVRNTEPNESAGPRLGALLETGRKHHVAIRVESLTGECTRITCRLDGRELWQWSGENSQLALSENWRLPESTLIGIGSDPGQSLIIEQMQIRCLAGDISVRGLAKQAAVVPEPWRLEQRPPAKANMSSLTTAGWKVNIESPGTESYHTQAIWNGSDLIEGQEYRLRFKAKASSPRAIKVHARIDEPNYRVIGLNETIQVTTDFREYDFKFTAHNTSKNLNRIGIEMGRDAGEVTIRDFFLTPVSEAVRATRPSNP